MSDQPDNLTTCFSAPIDKCDWEFLFARARPDELNGLPFIILKEDELYFMRSTGEDGYDSLAVILQDFYGDRDACLESAAWLRVKFEFNGMIYIVREATTADGWQSYATITANDIPEEYVAMVDFIIDSDFT